MFNVTKLYATDDATAATEAEADAPAAKTPAKSKPKPNGAVKAKAKAKPKADAKGGKKVAAKKAAPAKGKAKDRAKPVRDPAKLDAFGFRKGTIKSNAAALYAAKSGATLAEVKEAVGSVQFNLLKEVEEKGHTITRKTEKGDGARDVTRYKLTAKK